MAIFVKGVPVDWTCMEIDFIQNSWKKFHENSISNSMDCTKNYLISKDKSDDENQSIKLDFESDSTSSRN